MSRTAGDSGALVHPHLVVSLVTEFPGANGSQNQSLRQHPLNIIAYDLLYFFNAAFYNSDHKGNACP